MLPRTLVCRLGDIFTTVVVVSFLNAAAEAQHDQDQARKILAATGTEGGLIVHIGCGDGRLTAALRTGEPYVVHGLDADAADVVKAREYIRSLGLYGSVSADRLQGAALPYIDNLVNLLVAEELGSVPMAEVMRVLCPEGVAYIKRGETWSTTIKPRPEEIAEWTDYLYDASNNAVSRDTVVGPPRRLQWVGSPRHGRHHDRMSSVSAVVTAGGRLFYIFDEGSRVSVLTPPKWSLIARDAFNGTILWKRPMGPWHTHLWPLKSGPAQLPRRLVAAGDRVYATLSLTAPLTAIDAVTGTTIRTYEGSGATEEIILSEGVLYLLVNPNATEPEYADMKKINAAYRGKYWDEAPRRLMAVQADSGDVLWSKEQRVLPGTLAADARGVYLHDGQSVVSLDRTKGTERWRSDPIARTDMIRSFYLPILLLYKDVVLFSGGETAGAQTGSWYTSGKDTMTALSTETGKPLWSAYHPPSGYRSPEDLFVASGLVWSGETTSGRVVGEFTGRDPISGEVKSRFSPNVSPYWFHHRCYRGKATEKYLLVSRTGTEFIDVRNEKWIPHHWFRGACLYGVMPANGLIYAPQHPCACYLESKLDGLNALAPAHKGPRVPEQALKQARLEKGPAYGKDVTAKAADDDWPTFRHDIARSGRASTAVPTKLERAWHTDVGGKLTSPVVAGGAVFVASVHTHTIHALDAASGKQLWHYTAGGRVDSPPTIHQGRVLFGSADGYVYCLRASDGALAWRFRAAPMDQRLMSFEQLESTWPVHGSVLVRGGEVWCTAGRSMFLDGGVRLLRLESVTGRLISETVMDDRDPATGKDLHDYVSWLNMPPALPDVLSSDGRLVYMRSQPFKLDGTRVPLKMFPRSGDADAGAPPATQNPEQAHVFCPTGLLDDSWWHRTYWLYGDTYVSGWCGYYRAGKVAPSGRILVFDDERVYGFGRKPQYYRWTTPIEHQLFAAAKAAIPREGTPKARTGASRITVKKSPSLNPAGTALTVSAWIRPQKQAGAILARGGATHGYALYLRGGRPHFAVRASQELAVAAAKKKVPGRWAHLAGIMTAEKEVRIYVDGVLAATATASGLIPSDPAEAMQIGADEGSVVADYQSPFPFAGCIDEVKIYHRALSAEEIARHAAAGTTDTSKLVLSYSFDQGTATDASGQKNHGSVSGAARADGKAGRALRFTGRGARPPEFFVNHHWTKDLPVFARAMVLAGGTIFLAGPPDMIDEDSIFRQIGDATARKRLDDQVAALDGAKGATLLAVSAGDGAGVAQYELDSPPVFDGMAAAGKKLYMATTSGKVVCFRGSR